jgi:hypothetical protein
MLLLVIMATAIAQDGEQPDSLQGSAVTDRADRAAVIRGAWIAAGFKAVDRKIQTDVIEFRGGYFFSLSERVLVAPELGYDNEKDIGSLGGHLLYQASPTLYVKGGLDLYQFAIDPEKNSLASNNTGAIRLGIVALLGREPIWRNVYGAIALEFVNGVAVGVGTGDTVVADVERDNTGSTLGAYFVGYFR